MPPQKGAQPVGEIGGSRTVSLSDHTMGTLRTAVGLVKKQPKEDRWIGLSDN